MKKTNWLSLLLVLLMCIALLPASASAEVTTAQVTENITSDVDLPSNDEIFAAYVEREMYAPIYGEISMFGTLGRERLGEAEQKLYDILKKGIKDIAAGKRDSSEFIINDLFGTLGVDFVYTNDNLEMTKDQILVDGQMTEAAMEKLGELFQRDLNVNAVLTALLSDCPYDLYWYDKSHKSTGEGDPAAFSFGYNIGYSSSSGSPNISLFIGQWYCTFRVAESYATTPITADTSKTGATSAAISNAMEIVKEHKDKDDRAKLEAYRDEICDLVTYNQDAANGNVGKSTDPWQLIYVFDGNPNTNVVCEGYSKAFQYLCDLTEFDSKVHCYSVTGQMTGGTGAGLHMWNIVKINGGKYLVDVTNSDEGTVGANGGLFMVQNHSPTWLTNGYNFTVGGKTINYQYDSDTLNLWGDDGAILELVTHNHVAGTPEVKNRVEATCYAEGSYDEVVYCSLDGCHYEISRITKTLNKINHTPAEAVRENEVASTCQTKGSYDEVVYCSVKNCKAEISRKTITIEQLGSHTPADPVKENVSDAACEQGGTYDSVKYCEVCGIELGRTTVTVEALGHTAKPAVEENRVEPTCVDNGSCDSVVYCDVCGKELCREPVEIPLLGHKTDDAVIENNVPATCKADGSFDVVNNCQICGEEMNRETVIIPRLDIHVDDNGDGICEICGERTVVISFYASAGAGMSSSLCYGLGKTVSLPECFFPAPEGKQFAGWALTPNGALLTGNVTMEEGMSLYAVWEDLPSQDDGAGQPAPVAPAAPVAPPETGDHANIGLWLALEAISAATIMVLAVSRKRKAN